MESLNFTLQPSPRLAAFVVLASAVTTGLACALPASALVIPWCVVLALHALRRCFQERHIDIAAGHHIAVDGRAGEIVAGSFVAPWLTIVHWRPAGARLARTVVVLPDMLPAEPFRALRVMLRLNFGP